MFTLVGTVQQKHHERRVSTRFKALERSKTNCSRIPLRVIVFTEAIATCDREGHKEINGDHLLEAMKILSLDRYTFQS